MFINILFYWHFSGSRSSLVNMEARPLTSDMLTRRCVVTRLSDLTIERFKEAVQTLGAGAILILLPKNTSIAALEQKEVNLLTIMYTKMLCKISVFQAIWQGAEKNEKLCGNFGQYYAEESANYAEISNETIAASQLISKKTITASPLTSNKTITATLLISTQSTVKTINRNINKLLPRIWVHYIF